MLLGGGAFGEVSGAFNLEGGTLLNRINGFIREPQRDPNLFSTVRLASELEEVSHNNVTQNGTLILGFPTSKTNLCCW